MKSFLIIATISLLIASCNQLPSDASVIINNAIQFHDPKGEWKDIDAIFNFKSSFSFNDSVPEEIIYTINNQEKVFIYKNTDRQVEIEFHSDSCIQHTEKGSCEGYTWTKNFYPYIWGLPMKLTDSIAKIDNKWTFDTLKGRKCFKVYVHYEAEDFQFYFDAKDYQLRGFQFLKNDSSGKGEIVTLEDLYEFQGIKFPKKRTWLHLDHSLIGTNEVVSIQPNSKLAQ